MNSYITTHYTRYTNVSFKDQSDNALHGLVPDVTVSRDTGGSQQLVQLSCPRTGDVSLSAPKVVMIFHGFVILLIVQTYLLVTLCMLAASVCPTVTDFQLQVPTLCPQRRTFTTLW